jgi:putative phosphoesterase
VKLGLISDIHGNAAALEAVLRAARAQGVERILFAGDCVGYYYEPHRCLGLLAEWDVTAVRGNHENMLREVIAQPSLAEGFRRRYGSGLSTAVSVLSPSQLDFLAGLPVQQKLEIDGTSITLCHGAPWDTDEYVYPDASEALLERCAAAGGAYVVMGHTHYRFTARFGSTSLVNPGSVGQPRDRMPGAAWGLLDTMTGEFHQFTEEYDIESVASHARLVDPHLPYLWEVLERQ